MNGLLTVEDGTLYDVLEIAARNFRNFGKMPWFSLLSRMTRRLKQYNSIDRARRNVAHRANSTISSSTATVSIPAPISSVPATALTLLASH
jgi:hypothetical protein